MNDFTVIINAADVTVMKNQSDIKKLQNHYTPLSRANEPAISSKLRSITASMSADSVEDLL